ncbi:MAG: hypothetical protein ACI9OJ_005982, partial [Myxococcota bacterium]
DSTRSMRRRLRAIQKHLETGESLPDDIDEARPDDEVDEPQVVAEPDDSAEPAEVDETNTDPTTALRERILPRTKGLRALFVSNRTDPELQATLTATFEFKSLDWCDGSPRRVQTIAGRVAAGAYDMVLGATGFQSHSIDAQLIRACRRADVRYVRVHRGRPLACTLAIARELGIPIDD